MVFQTCQQRRIDYSRMNSTQLKSITGMPTGVHSRNRSLIPNGFNGSTLKIVTLAGSIRSLNGNPLGIQPGNVKS